MYPIVGGIPSLLVDAGANADCKPNNLLEFGIMGNIYMEKVIRRKDPKVGLVNIGAEAAKGSTLTKAAYDLLEQSHLNFIGNVEAREVPKGACDVIVTDGFTGNVLLKLTEGLGLEHYAGHKEKVYRRSKSQAWSGSADRQDDRTIKAGVRLLGIWRSLYTRGVRGPIVKMHGSSNANAVKILYLKGIP